MTPEEWQSRVNAAAGYRLIDLYGLSDLTEGVCGVRVEGEKDAFLVQPFGVFFDEVKASDLVKIRFDERPSVGKGKPLNYASCNQVKYFLQEREDIGCVIHSHTIATSVVATTRGGLKPINQHAFTVWNHLAYTDFDVDINEDCMMKAVERMQGSKKILLMENHGFMTLGADVAEAIYYAINLEQACRTQLAAQQAGVDLILPDDETLKVWADDFQTTEHHQWDGSPQWPGFLRKLQRENPGFDN